jgi:uncharacterized protein YndB with AHSA1/START domain
MTTIEEIADYATLADRSTLVIQRLLPGPVDRLWRYLTDSNLRQRWFASGDMQLTPGAALDLEWRNDALSEKGDRRPDGFSEVMRMSSQVLAVEPFKELSIAWGDGSVTFTLAPRGDRVLLTITHTGLQTEGGKSMIAAGWHMHLAILMAETSGEPLPSFWSGWTRLEAIYSDRLSG